MTVELQAARSHADGYDRARDLMTVELQARVAARAVTAAGASC